MKNIKDIIQEKLILNKTIKSYKYHPKDKFELREILEERLAEDKNANLNDIDVSQITDVGYTNNQNGKEFNPLFKGLDPHNIDISKWDVSNIKRMNCMFDGCEHFNCDLSKWDVSNVENMYCMFDGCKHFNCDLSNWNVRKVKDMRYMFDGCENFTGKGLEIWDIKNIICMYYMFDGCNSLKKLPSWYHE